MTQRASRFTLWVAVAVLLAVPALAQTTGAPDERVPITDAGLLESLGFPPGAENVYATPEAYAQMLMSPEELTAASALTAPSDTSPDTEPRSAFGPSTNGVSTIHASDFAPTVVNANTDYQVGLSGTELWCNDGTPTFVGVFDGLPHGARARLRRIWYFDDHAVQNITVWLQKTCLPVDSAAQPETTILRTNTSSGTPGYGRLGPGNFLQEDIDSKSCVYSLRARLANGGTCAGGGDLRLLKANLSWRRQISPAPGTATFDDVPTGHLFFQQIEALAGSGITSGCDADSFCPGAPLTRGQMAAFLATALGLNWDEPFWEP